MKRFWRWLRNHSEIDFLNTRIESLCEESAALFTGRKDAQEETEQVRTELLNAVDRERTGRIATETLNAAHRRHIDQLESEIAFLRTELANTYRERLKSLDALNLRLMEPRVVEPPPPDMKQFRQEALQKAGLQAVTAIRQINRDVDTAVLQKMYPRLFTRAAAAPAQPGGVVTNEPIPTPINSDPQAQ